MKHYQEPLNNKTKEQKRKMSIVGVESFYNAAQSEMKDEQYDDALRSLAK